MACPEDCQPLILADVGTDPTMLPRVPRIASSVGVTSQRNPSAYTHCDARAGVRPYPGTLTCERASVTFGTWGSPRNAHEAHAYMHAWNRSFMGSVLVVETLKSSILSLTKKQPSTSYVVPLPVPSLLPSQLQHYSTTRKHIVAQTSYPSSFFIPRTQDFQKELEQYRQHGCSR